MDDHLQRISQTLFEFQRTGYLCDTILTADDGQLKAHGAVLAAASPVFKASLRSDETEQVIALSGIELYVLESAVRFAYTGEIVIQQQHSSQAEVAFVVETLQQLGLQLPVVGINAADNGNKVCTTTAGEIEMEKGNGKAIATNTRRSKVKRCKSQTNISAVSEVGSDCGANKKCNATDDIDHLTAGGRNANSCNGNSENNYVHSEHGEQYKENQTDNCTGRDAVDCSKIRIPKSTGRIRRNMKDEKRIDSKNGYNDIKNSDENGTAKNLRFDSKSCGDSGKISAVSNKKKGKLCEHCGVIRSRSQFSSHMRVHDGDKPHACTVCGMRFSMRTNLMRHMKLHTGQRPYVCEFCGRGFIQSNMLTDHKYVHHRDKIDLTAGTAPYQCRSCSAKFFTTQQLSAHVLRNHRNASERQPRSSCGRERNCERPYACPECDSRFRFPSHLYTHLRLHTGELPHACTMCDKAFAQPQSLTAHMLVHNDVRPYACTVCGKRLRQAVHLRQHMYGHTGERPFPCKLCNKSYRYRADLRFHCTRVHQVQLPMKRRVCVTSKTTKPEPEPDSSRIVISSDTVCSMELCLKDILSDC